MFFLSIIQVLFLAALVVHLHRDVFHSRDTVLTGGTTKLLTKQEILLAADVASEYVEVEEWGGTVKIYAMTLAEHLEFERLKKASQDISPEQITFVLSTCLRDEQGECIFDVDEAKALLHKSVSVVSRLFMKCAELSKVSTEESEKN